TRAYIRSLDLARPPGEAVVYSCLSALVCAEIVEAVSGRPLDRFAAEHIFKPLKLTDTRFNPPERLRSRCVPTTRADRGHGKGGFLQGQVHDPLAAMQAGVSGNAGLFSTAADLSRFAQMMLNGGELDSVRILSGQSVRDMTRIQNRGAKNLKGQLAPRGLLWDVYLPDPGDEGMDEAGAMGRPLPARVLVENSTGNQRLPMAPIVDSLYAFGHTGYTGAAIRIYPEQGVYIIALTNRVHPDDSGKVEEFRRQVWSTVERALMGVSQRVGCVPDAPAVEGESK
ncbi:MAG: serine hydrolase domain-containing protein, partial [Phycisphaerae bacterium]